MVLLVLLVYLFRFAPGARCCCCGSCGFLLLLLLGAPTPPRPLYFGGGKYQKNKIAYSVGDGVWTCLCRRGRGGRGRGRRVLVAISEWLM